MNISPPSIQFSRLDHNNVLGRFGLRCFVCVQPNDGRSLGESGWDWQGDRNSQFAGRERQGQGWGECRLTSPVCWCTVVNCSLSDYVTFWQNVCNADNQRYRNSQFGGWERGERLSAGWRRLFVGVLLLIVLCQTLKPFDSAFDTHVINGELAIRCRWYGSKHKRRYQRVLQMKPTTIL